MPPIKMEKRDAFPASHSNHPFTEDMELEVRRPVLGPGTGSVKKPAVNGSNKPRSRVKKPSWRDAGYEFTQSTTLHGINRITESTPFTSRRVIWTMVVLCGMGLFVYQLAGSLLIYFQYPVTVNIKINYNKSVVFPAVTICNQNAFRLTKADQYGYYRPLYNLYTQKRRPEDGREEMRRLENQTLLQIHEDMAHDAADLIVNCSWHEETCDKSNFTRRMTNHGVCFTFNHATGVGALQASRTGAGTGLSLRFNIEQYEYMPGPNNGAGIKILVHDQDDVPLIREMAQAVPPGAKGLVGIQITKVVNLEPPYGKCEKDVKLEVFNKYTYSTCQLDCEHRHLVARCGCRMHYMPETTPGYPEVCTIRQYAMCGVHALDYLRQHRDETCRCPVPCVRSIFESVISYAHVSKLTTTQSFSPRRDGMMRRMERSRWVDGRMDEQLGDVPMSLQDRYIAARETTQRVDRNIRKKDQQLVASLAGSLSVIRAAINKVMSNLTSVIDTVDRMSRHNRVREAINQIIVDKVSHMVEEGYLYQLDMFRSAIVRFVSDYVRLIEDCESAVNRSREMDLSRKDAIYELRLDVGAKLRHLAQDIRTLDTYTAEVIDCLTNTKPLRYRPIFQDRFSTNDAFFPIKEIEDSLVNPRLFMRFWQPLKVILDQTKEQLSRIIRTFSADTGVDIYGRFYDLAENNVTHIIVTMDTLFSTLSRLKRQLELFQMDCRKLIESGKERSRLKIELLNVQFQKVNNSLSHLKLLIDGMGTDWLHLELLISMSQTYFGDPRRTKNELAAYERSSHFQLALAAMGDFFVQLTADGSELESGYDGLASLNEAVQREQIRNKLVSNVYSTLRWFQEEYANNRTALSLMAESFLTDKYRYADIMDSIHAYLMGDEETESSTDEYITLGNQLECLHSNLNLDDVTGGHWSTFFSNLDSWVSHLEEFIQGQTLDIDFFRENFLDVEVYMKELYYEEIEQQVGYDLVNLWSDIGGSLGLCVGASVITVAEIIDAFVHNLARRHLVSEK